MIAYLDASALVKRYVSESGSRETASIVSEAAIAGTCIISRAEVGAALARAARVGTLKAREARACRRALAADWTDLARLPVTEPLVGRAEELAWQHGLRGYDAVHLAAALLWQDMLGAAVTLVSFDRALSEAGREAGLAVAPEKHEPDGWAG